MSLALKAQTWATEQPRLALHLQEFCLFYPFLQGAAESSLIFLLLSSRVNRPSWFCLSLYLSHPLVGSAGPASICQCWFCAGKPQTGPSVYKTIPEGPNQGDLTPLMCCLPPCHTAEGVAHLCCSTAVTPAQFLTHQQFHLPFHKAASTQPSCPLACPVPF